MSIKVLEAIQPIARARSPDNYHLNTPAKQVSSKLAYSSARDVQRDLGENHGRLVAVSYIQNVSEAITPGREYTAKMDEYARMEVGLY
jgi:hypothetical protein